MLLERTSRKVLFTNKVCCWIKETVLREGLQEMASLQGESMAGPFYYWAYSYGWPFIYCLISFLNYIKLP